jgi:hypothetical protein
MIKTFGYLVSCMSVALLGLAAYPGAEKAGLLPALFLGMAASVVGMALRWTSYELERRRQKSKELETRGGRRAPNASPIAASVPSRQVSGVGVARALEGREARLRD